MKTLLFLISFFAAFNLHAASLIVSNNQLMGATGVDVGGVLYDVEFKEGTCIALFSGCDSSNDFTFTTEVDAQAASTALLDQVFLDTPSSLFDPRSYTPRVWFDTSPQMTFGCSDENICYAVTPYLRHVGNLLYASVAKNHEKRLLDTTFPVPFSASIDVSGFSSYVYADWSLHVSQVPSPAAMWLFMPAMFGFLGLRRKLNRSFA